MRAYTTSGSITAAVATPTGVRIYIYSRRSSRRPVRIYFLRLNGYDSMFGIFLPPHVLSVLTNLWHSLFLRFDPVWSNLEAERVQKIRSDAEFARKYEMWVQLQRERTGGY